MRWMLVLAALLAPVAVAAEPEKAPGCPDTGRFLILMTDQEPGAGTYLVDTATGRVWMPYVVPQRKADVVQLVELQRVDLGSKAWKKARRKGWPLGQEEWEEEGAVGPMISPNPVKDTAACIDKCVRHPRRGPGYCEKLCSGAGLVR